ncbi:short chain dehydrogenase reductase [Sporothrix brasiliensis 5110]|uniref:Short chain dehydrogenase reductase n=1 Tax=Sporothrix brasiliensis 5110 TaxID=1398154 RepID=A0A0C2FVJ4_9PEZI|nr:short chain dehydrogenase reductase [Sporothrix brasiliensis 5110]KIH95043.1 short chain dehydrogenase reductase [Sporothrix brasiliensis 5110]
MADRKSAEAAASRHSHAIPPPSFPTHNSPRTWFITQALSPLAIRLMRLLLAHGDYVVACLPPHDLDNEVISAEFRELADECRNPASGRYKDREGWKDRIRGIRCDGRFMGQCGAAVAEAVHVFGRIDIVLCCSSAAVVGAVEEVGGGGGGGGGKTPNLLGQNIVRDQFETVFFSQVNFIKAALPQLRSQRTGHVVVLSSIGGHIGMPGMPIHTAATWALEGYCDSLAYEIAPFNIKVTVVQPNTEVQTLSNRITFAPSMPEYEAAAEASAIAAAAASAAAVAAESQGPGGSTAPAADLIEAPTPSVRDLLTRVLDLHGENVGFSTTASAASTASPPAVSPVASAASAPSSTAAPASAAPSTPTVRYPRLPAPALDRLVLETVHALTAIGGHENPPTRHIVGFEASASVTDKLKTVSEELEDFVEASLSVDIFDSELKEEAREGRAAELAAAAAAESAAQLAADLE